MAETETYIKKHTFLVIGGSILFIIAGILNILDRFFFYWSFQTEFLGYVLFALTAISLFPIAQGIKELTDVFFVDHITKTGKQIFTWMMIYAGAVVLDMVLLGFPPTAGFVGIAILFGRVFAFLKLNKVFNQIKSIFEIRVGSIIYTIFAYYTIIFTLLGGIANASSDASVEILILIFKGPIESILMIIVGIKLIIDILRVRRLIINKEIKPYSAKSSFFVKDRKEQPEIKTTKHHIQSTTAIDRLREKALKREEIGIKSVKKKKKPKISKTPKPIYVKCPNCKENTDINFPYCSNCRTKLPKDKTGKITKMGTEEYETSPKRILTIKKEKILQQIVIALALIAFVTYAFVTQNTTLIVYSWIIIAIFATYIVVNYIILFFAGKGFAITTIIIDVVFLLFIVPVIILIFTYLIINGLNTFLDMNITLFRILMSSITIVLSLLTIYLMIAYRLRSTGMSLKEYIKHRFDFEARSEEAAQEKKRVEKKRSYFDKLDKVEEHMAKQRADKVINYEEFDYKQRIKDLGSPLEENEVKEE